jgi:hypothetical protein
VQKLDAFCAGLNVKIAEGIKGQFKIEELNRFLKD